LFVLILHLSLIYVGTQKVIGDQKLPKRALVNGYFRGRMPECLSGLNRTELSLVNLVSIVARIIMLPYGGHFASNSTCFSVINDMVQVASSLPRNPTVDMLAVIRTSKSDIPAEFMYSPYKVDRALKWLKANNPLYKNVILSDPVEATEKESNYEFPSIEANEEDYDGFGQESSSSPGGYNDSDGEDNDDSDQDDSDDNDVEVIDESDVEVIDDSDGQDNKDSVVQDIDDSDVDDSDDSDESDVDDEKYESCDETRSVETSTSGNILISFFFNFPDMSLSLY
jgi:hypothetical protein